MAFKGSSIDLESVHLLDCIFGIAVTCKLDYGMPFVSSCNLVFWKFDTLDITKRAEPLYRLKKRIYLSDVTFGNLVQDIYKATNIDLVIEVFL